MKTLGFFGSGKMASALIKGVLRAGLFNPNQIWASDVIDGARELLKKETDINVTASNIEVARNADVAILAVKPNQIKELLDQINEPFKGRLLVSIAAGVTMKTITSSLNSSTRVVRVMPNTPCLVGESASAFALSSNCSEEDAGAVQQIFGAVGMAFRVDEKLLDAVTGLSGSGPAYIYMVIEALSDGGVAMGLSRDTATKLAAQTVLGAAKMVLETGMHPGQLKDMVTSPGGTTIEGVHELEKGQLRATLINAVRAAAEKSRAMGQK
ncbi:MAG: pyrroline-5-carboxylate reductase [Verrucomicrobiae bacterium]|nr:pyrroline-5-carboxylate reductase [Verrucomicrobiae bacterium]